MTSRPAVAVVALLALVAGCGSNSKAVTTATVTTTASGTVSTVTVTASVSAASTVAPASVGSPADGGGSLANSTLSSAQAPASVAGVGLSGTAKPVLPKGAEGSVAAVAVGQFDGTQSDGSGSVPVIVRNNTGGVVRHIAATATASDATGKLVGSGSDQGFHPYVVMPGQIAIGYVFFPSGSTNTGSKIDVTVTSEPAEGTDFGGKVDLPVKPNVAGKTILGTITNPSNANVAGPIGVSILCFDERGKVLGFVTGGAFATAQNLAPHATTSFSADLFDRSCPTYLLGASGYSR